MKKFLYGASVQGIQAFIFQTNALKEIAGGSELVDNICTIKFAEATGKSPEALESDPNSIITAAGNIRYIFEDEELCRQVVLKFPREIMEFAPGVTINQAVVTIVDNDPGPAQFDELEKRLHAQRNKPFKPVGLGLMAVNRSRRTGLPTTTIINDKKRGELFLDEGLKAKRDIVLPSLHSRISQILFGTDYDLKKMPFEMEDITKSNSNDYSWIAIIHADGNSIGQIIRKIEEYSESSNSNFSKNLKTFSTAMDKSTKEAANESYLETIKQLKKEEIIKYPFRPVVLGGDDLTIICRADLALEFTLRFLKKFEEKTKLHLQKLNMKVTAEGLTSCAGIAFIKESYPFHYGYHLAEELCRHAKVQSNLLEKDGKPAASCLMFHKVLDSFVENYSEIIQRELVADQIHLDFGPYYLHHEPKADALLIKVNALYTKEGNAIRSGLRQWLSEAYNDLEKAAQKMNRLLSAESGERNTILNTLELKKTKGITGNKTPIYDWLSLASLKTGGSSND